MHNKLAYGKVIKSIKFIFEELFFKNLDECFIHVKFKLTLDKMHIFNYRITLRDIQKICEVDQTDFEIYLDRFEIKRNLFKMLSLLRNNPYDVNII